MPPQDCVANSVMLDLRIVTVLASIDFDDQSASVADKIEEIAAEGRLASNVEAALSERLEAAPKDYFGLAQLPAHLAGSGDLAPHRVIMFLICSGLKSLA